MAFRLFADDPNCTKESVLNQMFKDRYKNYCKIRTNNAVVKNVLKEVIKKRDEEDYNVWVKPGCIKQNEHYANQDGVIKCGMIYNSGREELKQACKDKYPHRINPFRTYIERALLWLFELDHG